MKTIEFDYNLPKNLIAQFPCDNRDSCGLMYLNRIDRSITHRCFCDLPDMLREGDRLVFNDTKVINARILCRKETGAKIELLFTERINDRSWKAIVRPAKRMKNCHFIFIDKKPSICLRFDASPTDGSSIVTLERMYPAVDTIEDLLRHFGEIPLPNYIKRESRDFDYERYQTVFAHTSGAIASPTAGLHFTNSLLQRLRDKGVDLSFLTLHVGIGTFKPVKAIDPRDHEMHEEAFAVNAETIKAIQQTRNNKGRIIAVGTTVVRALEQCALGSGFPVASSGRTRLLILPGFQFKATDGMVTNFHVPRSTLLMLVCAFAGKEFVFTAYEEAIRKEYRFYSYGDAMIIL